MTAGERISIMSPVKRVVVKLGTKMITRGPYTIDSAALVKLALEFEELRNRGYEIILVSSGAIAAGMGRMGLKRRPSSIPALQALASIGQSLLMNAYEKAMGTFQIPIGQILLTIDDIHDRKRYVNVRNTIDKLLEMGVLPVINENDTVATDEVKVGDNDNLSSYVASIASADLLVLFTDVDGLYDCDPRKGKGNLISAVNEITPEIISLCGGKGDIASVGGMKTKLEAAERVLSAGGKLVIANGKKVSLTQILKGENAGTLFYSEDSGLNARTHWIGLSAPVKGSVVVDEGAAKAVVQKNASLLPKGIKEVKGAFSIGDVISVLDVSGNELARGVALYDHRDVDRIKGLHSKEIEHILGYSNGQNVIHRNDMAHTKTNGK